MTAQEIIEKIKNFPIWNLDDKWLKEEQMQEISDMAIEALEKQMPKKIKHSQWVGIDGNYYDLCPNCEINLCTDGVFGRNKKYMKYCEYCGQALDWTEKE